MISSTYPRIICSYEIFQHISFPCHAGKFATHTSPSTILQVYATSLSAQSPIPLSRFTPARNASSVPEPSRKPSDLPKGYKSVERRYVRHLLVYYKPIFALSLYHSSKLHACDIETALLLHSFFSCSYVMHLTLQELDI